MDWIFGYKNKNKPEISADPSKTTIDQPTKSEKSVMEAYKFDSSALERAAKAARELESSRYSKEALELTKLQEITKQNEYLAMAKEYETHIQKANNEQRRMDHEEKRKTLQEESKQKQAQAQYQDELQRKRYEEQLVQSREAHENQLRRQEESVAKQEALRKATIEHEMKLKEKNKLKLIEAKALAEAKAERENKDVRLDQIRLKAQESRTTIIEGIKTTGSLLGDGLNILVTDRNKTAMAVGTISAIALGIYAAKGATSITARYIESRLGKPVLISDTSRFSFLEIFKHPIDTATRIINTFKKPRNILSGVILNPKLESKLRDVALETKNTKRNRGVYRNFIMYGPPGTGKTLFAKKLAAYSGMDYAIMTGGDVAPMGREAVTAIHKLFDWSSKSRKGVLLFIDEADAFLRKRLSDKISEDLRSAINAFLYRTSEQSSKFMLVLASNTPQQFDSAIHDRIDKMIEFNLPELEERERLIRYYFCLYVLQPASQGHRRLKIGDFDYSVLCKRLAKMGNGMSGRSISKLGVAWQAAAYSSLDGILTEQMVIDVFEEALQDHQRKMRWLSAEEKYQSTDRQNTLFNRS